MKGRWVSACCFVTGLLAIGGGIAANFMLNQRATDAVHDASVVKTEAKLDEEDWKKFTGETPDKDDPPLLYNYYLYHNTAPNASVPSMVPLGPFTYVARKRKYNITFSDSDRRVTFFERTEVTFNAELSGTVPEGVELYRVNVDNDGCPVGQAWLAPGPGSAVVRMNAGEKLSEWTLVTNLYTTGLGLFPRFVTAGVSEVQGIATQFGVALAMGAAAKALPLVPGANHGDILLTTNPAITGQLSQGAADFLLPTFGLFLAGFPLGAIDPAAFNYTGATLTAVLNSLMQPFDHDAYVAAAYPTGIPDPAIAASLAALKGLPNVACVMRLAGMAQMYQADPGNGAGLQFAYANELSKGIGFTWARDFGGVTATNQNPQSNCANSINLPFDATRPCFLQLFVGWLTNAAGPYKYFEYSFGVDVGLTNFLTRQQSDVTTAGSLPRVWTARPAKDFLRRNDDKATNPTCTTMTSSRDTLREVATYGPTGPPPGFPKLVMAFQDDQRADSDDIHRNNPKYSIYTGKSKLSLLNGVFKYRDYTALPSRSKAAQNGLDEWWFCEEDVKIEGKYLKQWPPGESDLLGFKEGEVGDADFEPVVFSDAIWRPVRFKPAATQDVKHHGIKVRRFELDPTQLAPDRKYDQYVEGVGNFSCFSSFGASYSSLGLPIFITRPYFRDAEIAGKMFVPGVIKGQTAPGEGGTKDLHETYLDIEPRTGVVFGVRERLQSNWMVPVPDALCAASGLSLHNGACGFLAPIYWLERSIDISEPLAGRFKSDFEDAIALKDMVWVGVGVGGAALLLLSSVAFLVICLRGKQPTKSVNW